MNNPFAMDQAEKVGLGAALGGHAFLLALLVFGLLQAVRPTGSDGGGSGDGISVEIVSEASTAPVAAAPVEEIPEAVEEPEILPEPIVEPAVLPTLMPKPPVKAPQVIKIPPKPIAKPKPISNTQPKPLSKPQPTTKPNTKPGPARSGGGSTDFEREMEKRLGGLGGGGDGAAKVKGKGEGDGKGASLKTAGQIRSEVNAILGPKILRYIRQCAPSGVDVNKIVTTVTLNLAANGTVSSLTGVAQRGVTDNNRPQAQPMERCVTGAIRKAAPFTELNAKDYDGWKSHRMSFQPN